MSYTYIEIRNYSNIKVCLIVYFITDISAFFSKISIHARKHY